MYDMIVCVYYDCRFNKNVDDNLTKYTFSLLFFIFMCRIVLFTIGVAKLMKTFRFNLFYGQ